MNTIQETKIQVSDVEIGKELLRTSNGDELLENLFYYLDIESSSIDKEKAYLVENALFTTGHHFVEMLRKAFNDHKPISISPDHFWLLICQGFAEHIKINSDDLRDTFVDFEGKEKISVQADHFIKGQENPWEEVFPQFSKQINEKIKEDIYKDIVLNFSTSTIKETTAFEISFMDSMSNYFDYQTITLCGIPEIILKGTREDYQKMLTSLTRLKKFDLAWWIDEVEPIIQKIIQTIDGEIDKSFWESIYKKVNESGGPFITGWILKFFPYIKIRATETLHDSRKNPILDGKPDRSLKHDDLPKGLSKVPFKWQYLGETFEMNFISGFIGIIENRQTNQLESEINWLIGEGPLETPEKDEAFYKTWMAKNNLL